MSAIRSRVAQIATQVIKNTPHGIRWAGLFRAVAQRVPEINGNTLQGSLRHFALHLPPEISKPERGLYFYGEAVVPFETHEVSVPVRTKFKEDAFYQSFADWLKDEVDEATEAAPIGGNGFGGKWGTPDVIGIYRPRKTDAIQFTEEVIAAEIKVDTNGLIVAFGQACAYKLFAHRVYIVVPRNAPENDLKRLDALAGVVGIGLVKFNPNDKESPEFTVMARAAKHEPDYFYTNEMLDKCKKELGL